MSLYGFIRKLEWINIKTHESITNTNNTSYNLCLTDPQHNQKTISDLLLNNYYQAGLVL